jgi:hypothetical protein
MSAVCLLDNISSQNTDRVDGKQFRHDFFDFPKNDGKANRGKSYKKHNDTKWY